MAMTDLQGKTARRDRDRSKHRAIGVEVFDRSSIPLLRILLSAPCGRGAAEPCGTATLMKEGIDR